MRVDLVVVCVAAVALSLPALSTCGPYYVMMAPNLLRVGTPEKVLVEAQDYTGGDLNVKITVMNFPKKTMELTSTTVNLNSTNQYMLLADITIPPDRSEDITKEEYVYVQAEFPSHRLEKLVLISSQRGYLFLQTDKTIYTPSTWVNFRIFALNQDFTPSKSSVDVKITNPSGIVIHKDTYSPTMGVFTTSYQIPDLVSFGTWSITASFSNTPRKNFTAEFEVKEYVLPSFEISLSPKKTFFYVDDNTLTIDIGARYLYGKEVTGMAFVMFGVLVNGSKKSLPHSLQRVDITDGEGTAILQKQHIIDVFPIIEDIVQSSIYVHASVLTETGSEMVEAEKRGIKIVTSPYTIHFKRTPRYFKPGMPFDVTVLVTNPDDSPAKRVQVVVRMNENADMQKVMVTGDNGMAKVSLSTPDTDTTLVVKAKTNIPVLTDARQASQEIRVLPYKPMHNSKNYLHIDVHATQLSIGHELKVTLIPRSSVQEHDITYMILSKGQIVNVNRFRKRGQAVVSLYITVTKDMVPSFRIVAYYHVGSSEVVSDSVWVDVKDTCMGKLSIEEDKKLTVHEPKGRLVLKITGDPGARVGLVAVDKGVYVLNNKHRLTQNKVWDVVEKLDTGCSPGSGRDSMGVFYDAGLAFVTNTLEGTSVRKVPTCGSTSNRRRRAVTIMEVHNTLAKNYTGEERQCCVDGMKKNTLGYSCERRAEFILDGPACEAAFLNCCRIMSKHRDEEREDILQLARSDSDEEQLIDDEIEDLTSRSYFPESWLWKEINLPSCPEEMASCEETFFTEKGAFPDSITSWQFSAISISNAEGICVAETFSLDVKKDFFIDLKLPYSAVRHEQIEIKAILHNNYKSSIRVRVQLQSTQDICSDATKTGKYLTTVEVEELSTRAVPFVIVPMGEPNKYTIEVKAMVHGSFVGDGVKKDLLVVSEGVRKTIKQTIILDPSNYTDGNQESKFSALRTDRRLPNSPANTYITVQGDEFGLTIEKVISGEAMQSIISQPYGCCEQNLFGTTMSIIAGHYLDKTNQWDTLGVEQRPRVTQYIQKGYQRQLGCREPIGYFRSFNGSPGGTWLTAYIVKIFSMASDITNIDENVICSGIQWLILNRQQPDGHFIDQTQSYMSTWEDSEGCLTAYVLITMQESMKICDGRIGSLRQSMNAAVQHLEGRINTLRNPYAVAMVSYALATAGKPNTILYQFIHEDGTHWPTNSHYLTLEATAYGLLALVTMGEWERAGPVVNWLNEQRGSSGGYGSTQSTLVVFQAMAEYGSQAEKHLRRGTDLDVEIASSGRSIPIKWTWDKSNSFLTRSAKFGRDENLTIRAKGRGKGTIFIEHTYYAAPSKENLECKNFSLSVTLMKKKRVEAKESHHAIETYLLTIDFKFMSNKDASMSILDVSLLTGFVVDDTDLFKLLDGKDRYIQKFEKDKTLSERGSLIIYLDKVSHQRADRIAFRVHKVMDVGLVQPAAVTVYEYYKPDDRCVKFYRPETTKGELKRLCIGDICQCAEGLCSKQRKTAAELEQREITACRVHVDFVMKATILEKNISATTDMYLIRVDDMLKKGTDDRMISGSVRGFVAHPTCRDKMDLQVTKTYLIMGTKQDVHQVKDGYQFVLGEQTWIEYWPTDTEGQESEFGERYEGITTLAYELEHFGCSQ